VLGVVAAAAAGQESEQRDQHGEAAVGRRSLLHRGAPRVVRAKGEQIAGPLSTLINDAFDRAHEWLRESCANRRRVLRRGRREYGATPRSATR
jgi:hypothetical protein